jgi:chromosome segregation ATPase
LALISVIAYTYFPISSKLNELLNNFEKYQEKQQALEVRVGILETRYDNIDKRLEKISNDLEYIKKQIK